MPINSININRKKRIINLFRIIFFLTVLSSVVIIVISSKRKRELDFNFNTGLSNCLGKEMYTQVNYIDKAHNIENKLLSLALSYPLNLFLSFSKYIIIDFISYFKNKFNFSDKTNKRSALIATLDTKSSNSIYNQYYYDNNYEYDDIETINYTDSTNKTSTSSNTVTASSTGTSSIEPTVTDSKTTSRTDTVTVTASRTGTITSTSTSTIEPTQAITNTLTWSLTASQEINTRLNNKIDDSSIGGSTILAIIFVIPIGALAIIAIIVVAITYYYRCLKLGETNFYPDSSSSSSSSSSSDFSSDHEEMALDVELSKAIVYRVRNNEDVPSIRSRDSTVLVNPYAGLPPVATAGCDLVRESVVNPYLASTPSILALHSRRRFAIGELDADVLIRQPRISSLVESVVPPESKGPFLTPGFQ